MSYAHFKAGWLVGDCSGERFIAVTLGWLAGQDGKASVSNAVLGHLCCMTTTTVAKHLNGLAGKGAISIRQRGRGKHITLHYDLTDEFPDADDIGRAQCHYCGASGVPMELDHVIPRARGGCDDPQNLVVACIACNTDKGALLLSEWRDVQ